MTSSSKYISTFMLIYFLLPIFAYAYNDKTTHPALTEAIIDFYNINFPQGQISQEEKEWIITGSTMEDTAPRWINHFYDPVNKTGWTGSNAGNLGSETVQAISLIGLSSEPPASALDWASNYKLQQKYEIYGGNRSWKRGLEHYADNEKKEAFITLGHILHVLEDMGVPDHTRDDTHAQDAKFATGDIGSPYEDYAAKWGRGSIKLSGLTGLSLSNRNSINDYITSVAEYSNKYFFSKDTINKYENPKVLEIDERFGYGVDENNNKFPIIGVSQSSMDGEKKYVYLLSNKSRYALVLDEYFSHLSRQIISNGAGVVKLFKSQAEDALVNKEFPNKLVDLDPNIKRFQFPAISLYSFGQKIVGFGSSVIASVGSLFSSGKEGTASQSSDPGSTEEDYRNYGEVLVPAELLKTQIKQVKNVPESVAIIQDVSKAGNTDAAALSLDNPDSSGSASSTIPKPIIQSSTIAEPQGNIPAPLFPGGVSYTPGNSNNDPPGGDGGDGGGGGNDSGPSGPVINNFKSIYSSSTMSAVLSWSPSMGNSSSSVFTYRVYQVAADNTKSIKLESGTSTSYTQEISEETKFEFSVTDENSSSTATTTTVSSDFYARNGNVFAQLSRSDVRAVGGNTGSHYFAQTFRPRSTGQLNRVFVMWDQYMGNGGMEECTVKIYKTDNPLGASEGNLVSELRDPSMGSPLRGAFCTGGSGAVEVGFTMTTSTLQAGEKYLLIYSFKNPTTQPFIQTTGDLIPGSFWVDGGEIKNSDLYFRAEGIVMSADIGTIFPDAPPSLSASFNQSRNTADISWGHSSDPDSADADIVYQIQITTSTGLSGSDWSDAGNTFATSTRVIYPNSYLIGARARDEYYNYSSVATTTFQFPSGFDPTVELASQPDAGRGPVTGNNQEGSRINSFGQTFSVTSSSLPESITIGTAWSGGGTCQVKIHQAPNILSANDSNLIAASDVLTGGNCSAESNKTFLFAQTGLIGPGNAYIWVYTIFNGPYGSDGIIGGYKEDQFPYSLSWTTSSFPNYEATIGREYNAYYILRGALQ